MKQDFKDKTILVFGGCGFIGSNFIRHIFNTYEGVSVVNVDALTYSGNPENLLDVEQSYGGSGRYVFQKGDIADTHDVNAVFDCRLIHYVINFAAETHVDRSIHVGAKQFIDTNVTGVFNILEAVKAHKDTVLKYVQVSTDEVYGQLPNPYDKLREATFHDDGADCEDKLSFRHYHLGGLVLDYKQLMEYGSEEKFTRDSPFRPNVPYSATKAAGDCLCNAYHHTWKVPVVVTHCTNNYGPFQYPEKLIPFFVSRLMSDQNVPVYGDGMNIRDWIHVDDHVRALVLCLLNGEPGQTYNIGADNERTNIEIASMIVRIIKGSDAIPTEYFEYVADRPGHDRRYAIDALDIKRELGWECEVGRDEFEKALRETIDWYQQNQDWTRDVITKTGVANPHIDLWKGHNIKS